MHNGILSVGAILRVLLLSEWLSELLLLLLLRRHRRVLHVLMCRLHGVLSRQWHRRTHHLKRW